MKKSYLLGVMRKTLFLFLALIAGLLSFSSVVQASTLSLPNDFTGTYGIDWPIIAPIYNTNDGNSATTDYFFEWTLSSRDPSNNPIAEFTHSVESWMPLVGWGSLLFPGPGVYTLTVQAATLHQAGGQQQCGPHSVCYDFSLDHNFGYASNDMIVTLNAIPIPASIWLFGSGLLGLVCMARRKKTA